MSESLELYNVNIERTILKSIIFDPELLATARSKLTKSSFYLPAHQLFFEAMCHLSNSNQAYDEVFIKKHLKGKFDENSMLEVLSANPIYNPTPYIETAQEYEQRRELLKLSNSIREKLIAGESPDNILQSMGGSAKNISDINSAGYKLQSITDVKEEKREFIFKNWLPMPVGTVSMLPAPGGVGKTWVLIQAAIRYAIEYPDKQSALWLTEDPASETMMRARAICEHVYRVDFNKLTNFKIFSDDDVPPKLIRNGGFLEGNFHKLRKSLRGYGFVGLDPIAGFYGGKENDNSEANLFMYPLKRWALEDKINITLLHHSAAEVRAGNRSGSRGATAFVDGCRAVYDVRRIYLDAQNTQLDPTQSSKREFFLTKDNYGVIKFLHNNRIRLEITPPTTAKEIEVSYENITTNSSIEMPIIK